MAGMPLSGFSPGCDWGTARPAPEAARQWGERQMSRMTMTLLFAIAMSVLTFAASLAEVPRSSYEPVEMAVER